MLQQTKWSIRWWIGHFGDMQINVFFPEASDNVCLVVDTDLGPYKIDSQVPGISQSHYVCTACETKRKLNFISILSNTL
jgi:hypothetical protein